MGDNDFKAVEDAREGLQSLLVEQAQAGVPEQVLVGLLREPPARRRLVTSIARSARNPRTATLTPGLESPARGAFVWERETRASH